MYIVEMEIKVSGYRLKPYCQLYHGENKLHFNEIINDICFVLDQHAQIDLYSANSLILQSADIQDQLLLIDVVCLVEKNNFQFYNL